MSCVTLFSFFSFLSFLVSSNYSFFNFSSTLLFITVPLCVLHNISVSFHTGKTSHTESMNPKAITHKTTERQTPF